MIDAVNSHAREVDGRKQYPTMHGADGWYGWRDAPWNVGALEVWYWSQKPQDLARAGGDRPLPAAVTGSSFFKGRTRRIPSRRWNAI